MPSNKKHCLNQCFQISGRDPFTDHEVNLVSHSIFTKLNMIHGVDYIRMHYILQEHVWFCESFVNMYVLDPNVNYFLPKVTFKEM